MMRTLSSWFGAIVLLGLVAAGFMMMVAPRRGKELLKNIAIATALFVVGSILLHSLGLGIKP